MAQKPTTTASTTQPVSPQRFDVGRLLREVSDHETAIYRHDSVTDFGHPVPPLLQISSPASGLLLALAYTPHFVYAQVLRHPETDKAAATNRLDSTHQQQQQMQHQPRQICHLESDNGDNEIITCMCMTTLEDAVLIRALAMISNEGETNSHQSRIGSTSTTYHEYSGVKLDDLKISTRSKSTSVCLLKGIVSNATTTSVLKTENVWVAAVLGTNCSRVYAVELILNAANQFEIVSDDSSSHFIEILPRDDAGKSEKLKRRRKTLAPFQPSGGVTSLRSFRSPVDDKSLYTWITYGDGMLIKLHSAGFFPSLYQLAAEKGSSLDNMIGRKALHRYHLRFTSAEVEHLDKIHAVPLPRAYPSPFALLNIMETSRKFQATNTESSLLESDEDNDSMDGESDDTKDTQNSYFDTPIVESIVFGTYPDAATLSFYSSEVQVDVNGLASYWSKNEESELNVIGAVVGGTKAIVGGIVGLGLGALRWTAGGGVTSGSSLSSHTQDPLRMEEQNRERLGLEIDLSATPFPSLWCHPTMLYPVVDFPDPPRMIESCSIDPTGAFAAMTDNLGRVLLFDLDTKQLIRIWKGYRDAKCTWIKSCPRARQTNSALKIVIHSRQRRVVDIWCARHGPRLSTVQVEKDAEVISFDTGTAISHTTVSYLLHSKTVGNSLNRVEELIINDSSDPDLDHSPSLTAKASSSIIASRGSTLRLQHLRQLLSTPSVRLNADDIYEALRAITLVTDLATALDLLAEAEILEEKLGVNGSTFQKLAVALCNETLIETIKGGAVCDIHVNPNVTTLSRKIEYFQHLIKAFDVIHKFETTPQGEERHQDIRNPSFWVMEAMGWASTYQKVMRVNLDSDLVRISAALRFSSFASACHELNNANSNETSKIKIYLSDSSRIRRDILIHFFKPLLSDVYSARVVNSALEFMGIANDYAYLQKCFGEWSMTLPILEFYQKGLLAAQSQLSRFLKDIAVRQLDKGNKTEDETVLGELYKFCVDSTDLIRAFMLGVLCREAAEKAAYRKEKMTYGKVLTSQVLRPWDDLLRKLRVCLLVSLRLKNIRLAAPMSIANVEAGDLFSVYEWLSHDELLMSHKHDELVALEDLCKISAFSFDPSTPEGDGPSRFKQLQNACLSAAIGEDERPEFFIEMRDEDRFGSLLLFSRNHNNQHLLSAHRSRLLSSMWISNPKDLDLLIESLAALDALLADDEVQALAIALTQDIWYSCICPVYRAQLVGFDEVHEISEELLSPLLLDQEWFKSFGKIALRFLEILKTPWAGEGMRILNTSELRLPTWPPVRTDHILKHILGKSKRVDRSSIETHTAAVISLMISRDSDSLIKCIPAVYDCFVTGCLNVPMMKPTNLQSRRHSFVEDAILFRAISHEGSVLETFFLDDIKTLCVIWGFDVHEAHTLFLLSMYEVGKDRFVDELLARGSAKINARYFVESGVDIACRRLHAFLSGKEMQSPDMGEIMGMLDADLCEWIKNRARMSFPSTPILHSHVSITQTHLFALRLLSLSASADVETALRVKIHSMVVLSGTIVKVLEIRSENGSMKSTFGN